MDYYFAAPTAEALISALSEPNPAPKYRFQVTFENVITPIQGRAAVEETTDIDGSTVPAQPACGDPNKWYCCIRSQELITPPEGVEAVDPSEGASVCGVWS